MLAIGQVFLSAQAQIAQVSNRNVSFPSPNVAALGTFGDFPAVGSTGVPDISVPIYTVKSGDASIPIALQYNPNMVKPDYLSSWVGIGWNLNVGGAITRNVKGQPDDLIFYDYDLRDYMSDPMGYYYTGSFFLSDSWASTDKLNEALDDMSPVAKQYIIPWYARDYFPDEFSFSFLGISGSFYLTPDKQWKVRCNQKVKVNFDEADLLAPGIDFGKYSTVFNKSMPKSFGKFTLTDANGVKYVFGGVVNAIEYSAALINYNYPIYSAKTWYLTKIILPGDKVISFDYERGTGIINAQVAAYNATFSSTLKYQMTGSVVVPSYLSKITTDEHVVIFSRSADIGGLRLNADMFGLDISLQGNFYLSNSIIAPGSFPIYNHMRERLIVVPGIDPDAKMDQKDIIRSVVLPQLDEIKVLSVLNASETVKQVKFEYDDVDYRLVLNKVVIDPDRSISYDFSYNNEEHLPSTYFSTQTDSWGYYNGKIANFASTDAFKASREPDASKASVQLLKRVTYPTGGYTTYDFEAHTYAKSVNTLRYSPLIVYNADKTAGGARIKKITNYDHTGALLDWVSYGYTSNGLSTGILGGLSELAIWITDANSSQNIVSLLQNQQYPLSEASSGSHISYSRIWQQRSNGGYTYYNYSNYDTDDTYAEQPPQICSDQKEHSYAFQSRVNDRGLQLRKAVYDSRDQLMEEIEYSYERLNEDANYLRGYVFSALGVTGCAVKEYVYPVVLKKIVSSRGNNVSNLVVVDEFVTREVDMNVTDQTRTVINGQVQKTHFKYPYDYFQPLGQPTDNGNSIMYVNNILSPVLSKEVTLDNNQVEKDEYFYQNWGNGYFGPETIVVSKTGSPKPEVSNFVFSDKGNMLYTEDVTGIGKSYLWGYSEHYPIAEVVGARNTDIFHENFESSSGFDGNLRTDQTRAKTGNYSGKISNSSSTEKVSLMSEWLNVGMSGARRYRYSAWVYNAASSVELVLLMKKQGETGYTTYTESISSTLVSNDWFLLEKEVVLPADVIQIAVRLDANASGSVWFDDVRLCPTDAKMKTYTYRPLVGISSVMDENNIPEYYEYDNQGRLLIVRDDKRRIVKRFTYNYINKAKLDK